MACSNQTEITPSAASSSTAISTPILIPTSTHTATAISVSAPSMTPTIEVFSSQFCMGATAAWSCSCGDLSYQDLQIKNASQAGFCDVTVPNAYSGYNMALPDNWFCQIAGVAATNLSCVSESNQRIFLQLLVSELPITEADQAVSVFQEGEGKWSVRAVEPGEKKISRELVTIGDKQVLKLLTSQKESFILRYFIKNGDYLYVLRFEMKDPDDQESKKTVIVLEEAVQSMRFLR